MTARNLLTLIVPLILTACGGPSSSSTQDKIVQPTAP